MPQPQLDRRAAVGPIVEVRRNGLPSLRSGVAVRPSSTRGERRPDEGVEAIGGQAVALVHHHGVPVLRTPAGHQVAAGHAVDGGEEVVPAFGLVPPVSRSPNSGRAAPRGRCAGPGAGSPRGAPRTADEAARLRRQVRGSRTPPPPSCRCRWPPPPGCGAAVGALCRQLLQHVLLVGLGLQVEEAGSWTVVSRRRTRGPARRPAPADAATLSGS
jgi:hypothetical protein